jgi:hypothetical protein
LPGRLAFCMRDVSHQAAGAQVLGLARFNLNMLRKFAAAIADSRAFCSYWEIDKYNRPAPVDYKNDQDFWYNLPANFDVLDACWRQFLWTGDRVYLDAPEFKTFYARTVNDYIRAWDRDGDGIPDHRPRDGNRGLGSYDEGPDSERTMMGADLVAALDRGLRSYAAMLEFGGDPKAAAGFAKKADHLRSYFAKSWWSDRLGRYAAVLLQGRRPLFEDAFWSGMFPLYFGFIPPGPRRQRILEGLLAGSPEGIEVESYLPEVYYRCGRAEEAYAELLKICAPETPRRDYPEASFAVIGAIASGLFGLRPDARGPALATRPSLTAGTDWAEIKNVPVLGNVVNVRQRGAVETTLENAAGPEIAWKAVVPGRWAELLVDGAARPAETGPDDNRRDVSWVLVRVAPGARRSVSMPPQDIRPGSGLPVPAGQRILTALGQILSSTRSRSPRYSPLY